MAVEARIGLRDERAVEAPRAVAGLVAGNEQYGTALGIEGEGEAPFPAHRAEPHLLGQLINLSQSGQAAIRELIAGALKRIERDPGGVPIKLCPFTRHSIRNAPATVLIDPALAGGRPVIAGTGLATQIIAERYKLGESISALADDYERPSMEIEEAIRCELEAAA